LLVTMIGSAVSGMILSKHVFGFLDLKGASSAREIHMLCGYWKNSVFPHILTLRAVQISTAHAVQSLRL